ncbi:MAG TPA: YetF domain-containing protein [Verrucomicrobiae bacterium]|nr:YetF domain-containing protein [Verrucomicrobiae bacterium]
MQFGNLVKGHEDIIIKEGKLQERAMRRNHISEKYQLRREGNVESAQEVKTTVVERNGNISVVLFRSK